MYWGLYSPYREMGYTAFKAAGKGPFQLGTAGAGTGAATATHKGGIGSASAMTASGHRVAALMAVNAMGSPTIGEGPHFWAASFERDGEFGGLGLPQVFDDRLRLKGRDMPATTIGVVVTDAVLTKAQAHRMSILAHDGLARAILPTHLPGDGDTILSAATGAKPLKDPGEFFDICHLATLVTARAIARGVYEATALPVTNAQPAWRDKFSLPAK
jgi:L-aminopeptidase/D-esterase-like protein